MRWALLFTLALLITTPLVHADNFTVSAAISLKESLEGIRKLYESSGDKITFNFDASGKLAAQIQQGAPVDLFISADDAQMDKLRDVHQIEQSTRQILVTNALVLIVPADEPLAPKDIADLIDGSRRIAIGEPKTVPAGRYAMQTLQKLQLDEKLKSRLVYGQSVREVLTLVQRDEAIAGFVYTTDALAAGNAVKVVATADASSHDAIEYPAAVITGCAHPVAARRFLDFLAGESAQAIFQKHGFSFPAHPATRTSP